MAERDTRTAQEKLLHMVLFAEQMLECGKVEDLKLYLSVTGEEAQAGMSTVEVDAVRKRVDRAVKMHLNHGTNK